jgi:hypothetical protein
MRMLPVMTAMTEASQQAVHNLRVAGNFQWYLVPLLAFIIYIYVQEVEKRNWNIILTGLAFFAAEFVWEMFNALILHWTGNSAMWTTPGPSAYIILVGLTIEIAMMFSVAGVIFTKILPEDRELKILGIPNRLFCILSFALFCVFVEVLLNQWGALVWYWPWWRWPNIWLIIAAYACGFWLCAWFYDLKVSLKAKAWLTAATYGIAIVCFLIFAVALQWV